MHKEKFVVPLRLESVSNVSKHWTAQSKEKNKIKRAIKFIMCTSQIKPPCKVILTRVAPRALDAEDNLPMALKTPKDAVADVICPGLAPGRADGNKNITWEFSQRKGLPKTYALEIELQQE